MDYTPSPALQSLLAKTTELVDAVVAPMAGQVDREGLWPAHSMQVFARAGLTGLQVPQRLGGHGQGQCLLALTMITEAIARACPSSALCFGMHCVGTAVIAAKATPLQEQRYLRPIAEGRHITTLALSESGFGAHFYLPETSLTAASDSYLVNGTKQFITNGGHADSYVLSTRASCTDAEAGDFSCLIVDADTARTANCPELPAGEYVVLAASDNGAGRCADDPVCFGAAEGVLAALHDHDIFLTDGIHAGHVGHRTGAPGGRPVQGTSIGVCVRPQHRAALFAARVLPKPFTLDQLSAVLNDAV